MLTLISWYEENINCCLNCGQVIRNSIIGLGTDEDSLTRAIVTRAEIDTMKIRGEYNNMYNSSLDTAVIDDTSGDYKNFLMTLLGARMWITHSTDTHFCFHFIHDLLLFFWPHWNKVCCRSVAWRIKAWDLNCLPVNLNWLLYIEIIVFFLFFFHGKFAFSITFLWLSCSWMKFLFQKLTAFTWEIGYW